MADKPEDVRRQTMNLVRVIASNEEPAAGTEEHEKWMAARDIVAQREWTYRTTLRSLLLGPHAMDEEILILLIENFESRYRAG
jgi:hypothetical protein